ncbi:MAG: hypothetical protein A2Y10_07050 [Planctomycetes bacterium GWF2_41_51]|nr:MAG: hypothetical protein A2Y10_07050 [Planctomycetes bacterium GWF2_41_51]HBG28778.1 hypothetical protein [Phycisphaerales bacterium]
MEKNEFLYLSYLSPPLLAGGVARVENNCKLLPVYGWEPTLLTACVENSSETDTNFAQNGVNVLRPNCFLKENKVRALPKKKGNKISLKSAFLKGLARWFLMPDRQVLWNRSAKKLALSKAEEHDWKCVFACLNPISTVGLGYDLAKKLNLPFVMEFQDIICNHYEGGPPTFLHRYLRTSIVRKAASYAKAVIVMSNSMKDWVVKNMPVKAENVYVIPIGFVSADQDYIFSQAIKQNDKFTMVYAGTFQRDRRPDVTFRALKMLLNDNRISADKIKLVLISNLDKSIVSEFGVEQVTEVLSMMPRKDVFRWYAKADLLLLICDKMSYQNYTVPGKIFEYLMTEKPILGLADKTSEISQILNKAGTGYTADADDIEEVAGRIYYYYKLWENNELKSEANKDYINTFSCGRLVKQLGDILAEVTKK